MIRKKAGVFPFGHPFFISPVFKVDDEFRRFPFEGETAVDFAFDGGGVVRPGAAGRKKKERKKEKNRCKAKS
jgi:hypothetical protein